MRMLKEEKDFPGKDTELGEEAAYIENGTFASTAGPKGRGWGDSVGQELKIVTAKDME